MSAEDVLVWLQLKGLIATFGLTFYLCYRLPP